MKISIFAISAIATVVAAQSGPGSGPPSCGTNALISIISSSGCSIGDAECLCKNDKAIKQAQTQIPKACKATADQQAYAGFFNLQCFGKPGYPISMGNAKADGSSPTTSGSSSTTKSDARTNRVRLVILAAAAAGVIML